MRLKFSKKRKIPITVPLFLSIALAVAVYVYAYVTFTNIGDWGEHSITKFLGVLFTLTPVLGIAAIIGIWIYWVRDNLLPIYGLFTVPAIWWGFVASLGLMMAA